MTYIIYKITNSINDKVYIGCTKQSLKERWRGHLSKLKIRKSKLYNAINKYGKENFKIKKIIKIEDVENVEQAYDFEKMYIKHYDSFENGYNSTTGGQQSSKASSEVKEKLKNRKFPKEYWDKIKKSNTGQKRSREIVKKASYTYLLENKITGFKKEVCGLRLFCEENNISFPKIKHTIYRGYYTRDGWKATEILDKGEQIG